MLKIAYITRILYSCQQKGGVCFNYFWFREIMDHVVTMFQADREHSGSMLSASLEMIRSFFGRKSIML